MGAPKGNQFWKQRSKHGRDKLFSSPEVLSEACVEYFEWVELNPLEEMVVKTVGGKLKRIALPKMRAMTVSGLCIFLDIDQSTWFDYAKDKDFTNVTTRAMEIIRTQKFEGASADLLNANIIARDLGLADKKEHAGPDGGPIEYKDATDQELENKILALTSELDADTDNN